MSPINILIIDDLRDPKKDAIADLLGVNFPSTKLSFYIARSSHEALNVLHKYDVSFFDVIFFDHDLGYDDNTRLVARYVNFRDAKNTRCFVHTSNPTGRDYLVNTVNGHSVDAGTYFIGLDEAPNALLDPLSHRIMMVKTRDRSYMFDLDAHEFTDMHLSDENMSSPIHMINHNLNALVIGDTAQITTIDYYGEVTDLVIGNIISIKRTTHAQMNGMFPDYI